MNLTFKIASILIFISLGSSHRTDAKTEFSNVGNCSKSHYNSVLGDTNLIEFYIAFDSTGCDTTECNNLQVTCQTYSETDDLTTAVQNEIGSNYTVADWNDIIAISDLEAWAACMGLDEDVSFMVTKNGNYIYSGSRQYFVVYSTDGVASSFAIHAQSGNFYLGSWYGLNKKILAINGDNTTGSISGKVTSNLNDFDIIAGATVIVDDNTNWQTTTDYQGNYIISDIPTGAHNVKISHPGQAYFWESTTSLTYTKPVTVDGDVTVNFEGACRANPEIFNIDIPETYTPNVPIEINFDYRNTNYAVSEMTAYVDVSLPDKTDSYGISWITPEGFSEPIVVNQGDVIYKVTNDEWQESTADYLLMSFERTGAIYYSTVYNFTVTVMPPDTGDFRIYLKTSIGDRRWPSSGVIGQQNLTERLYIVTVQSLPEAPTANNVSACYDGQAYFGSATVANGEEVVWYTTASGTAKALAPSRTDPGISFAYAAARDTATGYESSSRTLVTATVYALPEINSGPTEVCVGENITLTTNGTGGTGWTSSNTDVATINPSSGEVTAISNGTTQITYTDEHSCTSEEYTVTVNPLPEASISVDKNEVCQFSTDLPVITITCFNGTGPYTVSYSINKRDIKSVLIEAVDDIRTSDLEFDTDEAGLFTFSITSVEDANGCVNPQDDELTITIYPLPEIEVTAQNCSDDRLTWEAELMVSSGDVSVTNGNAIDLGNNIWLVSNIPTGESPVVIVTNSYSCYDSLYMAPFDCDCPNIAPPVSDGDVIYCQNSQIPSISATVGTDETVNWYDASAGGTLLALENLTFQPNQPGSYFAEAINTLTGCTSSTRTEITVSQLSLPDAEIYSDKTIVCYGDENAVITFEGSNGTAPYTFSYVVNGGSSYQVSTTSSSSIATINTVSTMTGDWSYELLSVSDANGCINYISESVSIEVLPSPIATIQISDTEICAADASPEITFTGINGTAPYTFEYQVKKDNEAYGSEQYITTEGGNSVILEVPADDDGSFTYKLIGVSDANTCYQEQSGEVSLVINSLPTLELTRQKCDDDGLTWFAELIVNRGSVTANKGDVLDLGDNLWLIEKVPEGESVTIIVSDEASCSASINLSPFNCDCPLVPAPISLGDKTMCSGENIPELTVEVDNLYSVLWYESQTESESIGEGISFTPTFAGDYWAEALLISSPDCKSTRTKVGLYKYPLPMITEIAGSKKTASDYNTWEVQVQTDGGIFSANAGQYVKNGNIYTVSNIPVETDLTLTVTSDFACTSLLTIESPVSGNDCPTMDSPVAEQNSYEYCEGSSVPEIKVSITNTNDYTVYWYKDDVLLENETGNLSITNVTEGTYQVETRYLEKLSCTSSRTTIEVIENPLPAIDYSSDCSLTRETWNLSVNSDAAELALNYEGESSVIAPASSGSGTWEFNGLDLLKNVLVTAVSNKGCEKIQGIIPPTCTCPTLATPQVQIDKDCEEVVLTVTNPDGTQLWNTGDENVSITVYSPGKYTVFQEMYGCVSNTAEVEITDEDFLYPKEFPIVGKPGKNPVVLIYSDSLEYTHTWYYGNEKTLLGNGKYYYIPIEYRNANSRFFVEVTNQNYCTRTFEYLYSSSSSYAFMQGNDISIYDTGITIYPNPAGESINIVVNSNLLEQSVVSGKIYTITGQYIQELTDLLPVNEIDTKHLLPGIYQVVFYGNNQIMRSKKLIIK